MALAQPISDTLVQEFIIRAVRNVCSKMLKRDASFVEKSADAAYAGFKDKLHFFGSVGFVGQIDGIVYLCIPDDFVQDAAGRVLGLSAAEIEMSGDSVLKDVVGEITSPSPVSRAASATSSISTAPATGSWRTSRCGRSEVCSGGLPVSHRPDDG
jgi:hypothetical protein